MNILIAGASGLVGNELLELAQSNTEIKSIHLIGRRKLEIEDSKIEQHIVAFSDLEKFKINTSIDTVFCCLGTTIKKAGTQEKFKLVDYNYVVNLANWTKVNGANQFVVVSAMGASPKSSVFYSKVKGQMQEAISNLNIPSVSILQPSLLMGNRPEFRLGEKIAIGLMSVLNIFFVGPLKKYKSIQAQTVASAMFNLSKNCQPGVTIFTNDELFNLAKKTTA